MKNYLVVIIEVDEYKEDSFSSYSDDESLKESINDVFYSYIENSSDYSNLYFSTGPYNDNCIILYYKEISLDQEEIHEIDAEAVNSILSDLKRNVHLYIINSDDFNNISENANDIFPIENIDSSCISKTEFE